MVWSSASSTLIGPFVVAFVFRSSPNTHPLRSVGAFGNVLYPLRLSVSGSAPLRGRRGAHPYVAPCEFERYSPKCVEGKFSEVRRDGVLRSSIRKREGRGILRGVSALKIWRRDEQRENQAEARATDRAAQRQTIVDPEPRQKEESAGEEVGTEV